MLKIKNLSLLAVVVLLAGCQHEKSYSYLVSHPDALKKEIEYCQNTSNPSVEVANYCEMVSHAGADFMGLFNDWRTDAEGFGQKIMAAQLDCVKADEGVQTAKVELKDLQAKHADAESIRVAQDKLSLAEKDSEEKRLHVKAMLGVLSLTSPG